MMANCSYVFPVPFLGRMSEGLITEEVIKTARAYIEEYKEQPFYSPCYSTVRHDDNVLGITEFSGIKNFIVESISTYCDFVKINKEGLELKDAWLNLYEQHGYQDLHTHEDSVISGVFYLKSSGKRDFIIQAPWHFFQPAYARFTETDVNNCHNLEYESTAGKCYVFPSHLMHRTLPADQERISLSFNVRYTRK